MEIKQALAAAAKSIWIDKDDALDHSGDAGPSRVEPSVLDRQQFSPPDVLQVLCYGPAFAGPRLQHALCKRSRSCAKNVEVSGGAA